MARAGDVSSSLYMPEEQSNMILIQDWMLEVILVTSHTLRLTEEHLKHTLGRQYVFRECGLLVRGMNFPPLHAPVMALTLDYNSSQLSFLVFWKLAVSFTPTISKCSDMMM